MADRPILFSTPMVQGLIREIGRPGTGKTQTRRLPKILTQVYVANDNRQSNKPGLLPGMRYWNVSGVVGGRIMLEPDFLRLLPYHVGDRLYVREAWRCDATLNPVAPRDLRIGARPIWFEAGFYGVTVNGTPIGPHHPADLDGQWIKGKFRQAMHMPRWASRLTLTVTEVRVERLQDITKADALAEGIVEDDGSEPDVFYLPGSHLISGVNARPGALPIGQYDDPRKVYRDLLNNLHGGDLWSTNPWVAAYTFTVQMGNIDQLAAAHG